ncbi:protein NRT1/ PTR FAMILY 5.5 isoform X2 [Cajanus cajan]|uniref:protein NRT1/ PTR FAMILY 5.5 isoform X2 n=1 Tax=Cajanus cajan TaxID=3821 RepID=UPI0010FB9C5E|nr:protein NRT1/ PTR FAMILY 5.5 isoform X2 [Cajanus cajan]
MGCFTMITLCTAASIEGLMLLWTSTTTVEDFSSYAAIFILALGKSGQKLSEKFLEYQLEEKIKEKTERELEHGSRQNNRAQDHVGRGRIINIWLLFFVSIVGYVITVCMAFTMNDASYRYTFRVAALLMGGTHLFFLFGCVGYRRKELRAESYLHMIYRICKAASGKRKSKYPATANSYHWKNYKQKHLYKHGRGLRLSPRVPRLFGWLDKAAIVEVEEENGNHEMQEKKGKLCMVKEVREVKSLVPMIYLYIASFGYDLLLATKNTFFVSQVTIMTSITKSNRDIWILFLISDIMIYVSEFICFIISFAFGRLKKFRSMDGRSKRKAGTLTRIGFGMLCAVTCCLVACLMESRRLSKGGMTTTMTLVPQFVLVGTTEGFVEGGLGSLFQCLVAKSMWSFEESFTEIVMGTGKLLTIPVVLFSSSWIKETINTSHLNRYYLLLGILNAAFLVVFGYYSIRYAYKEAWPEDELEHPPHQPDSHQENDDNEAQPEDQGMTRLIKWCGFAGVMEIKKK